MTDANDLRLIVEPDGSPHADRLESLMQSIWSQLPNDDQWAIIEKLEADHFAGVLVVKIECNWLRFYGTNAMLKTPFNGCCTLMIDGGYINAADDRHISSTVAHEFGHLRGNADGDLSEDKAHHFQQTVWGFPPGEVIFKCEVCRHMDQILSSEGDAGQILWSKSHWEEGFIYLPEGERLALSSLNYQVLQDHPTYSLEEVLYDKYSNLTLLELEAHRGKAWWRNEMDEIAERYEWPHG